MKIEREKIVTITLKSEMKDVGEYSQKFLLKRQTPFLQSQYIRNLTRINGGIEPSSTYAKMVDDCHATLMTYVSPIDNMAKPIEGYNWIDDILDNEILFAIQRHWVEYQNSFFETKENSNEAMADKP